MVWPAWSAIKVDDTTVGVAEGLNAGAWAVGVAVSGNCFGLSLADSKALGPEDFARRRARAEATLYGAGAHYVIDSAADLMPVVARIEGLLARGERPGREPPGARRRRLAVKPMRRSHSVNTS